MASPVRFTFRKQWRGYDRAEVERFLEDLAAERQYLLERIAALEATCAEQRGRSPQSVVNAAAREATEIRSRAQREAREMLQSAEQMADRILCDRLESSRHELDRLNTQRREIENWLGSTVGAIRRAHDLVADKIEAVPPPVPTTQAMSVIEAPHARAIAPSTRHEVERPTPSMRPPQRPTLDFSERRTFSILEEPRTGPGRLFRRHPRLAVFGVVIIAVLSTLFVSASIRPRMSASNAAVRSDIRNVRENARHVENNGSPHATGGSAAVQTPAQEDGLVLVLTAYKSCWIRTVIDGAQPMERTMQVGEVIFVRARDEALLRVGDGTALALTINGKDALPLGRSGEVVMRRITRANYKEFLRDRA